MSEGQQRVLVMLLILLGLEIARSQQVRSALGLSTGKAPALSPLEWKKALIWFIGALVLLFLADIVPTFTVWLVVLLLAGVILANADEYTQLLQVATQTIYTKG